MKNRRNYYRILHIQPDAPADIIKASYRTQMQKLKMHPDLGGDEWDASILNEAYRVLSHPEKRAAYDRTRRPREGGTRQQSRAAASGPEPTDEPAAEEPVETEAVAGATYDVPEFEPELLTAVDDFLRRALGGTP